MPSTYDPLATTTLVSNTASYSFTSISASYTDLVLIVSGNFTTDVSGGLTFNNDNGANYRTTRMYGNGSAPLANGDYSGTQLSFTTGNGATRATYEIHIMNYSNASIFKTVLMNVAQDMISVRSGVWKNINVINRVDVIANGLFAAGTTLTLYGIKAV